jgi:hypothetical protein
MVYRRGEKLESNWDLPLFSTAEGALFLEEISGVPFAKQ